MTDAELQVVAALNRAVVVVGSQSALAAGLGKAQGHVYYWLKTGRLPFEYCMPIEKLTSGAVTRRMLRPTDWADHWPELVNSEPNPAPAPASQAPAASESIEAEEATPVPPAPAVPHPGECAVQPRLRAGTHD